MRILVVEDNPKMADAIRKGLVGHGYVVDVCHGGFEGEEHATMTPSSSIACSLIAMASKCVGICAPAR